MNFVLMGVSGSGKSTVGLTLAAKLGYPFFDGDDFHPPENVAKMSRGLPLDDADRATWLESLAELLAGHSGQGESLVLACSALKRSYRDRLRAGNEGLQFIYLQGNYDLIWQRMQARPGHYMKTEMLSSQFAALEEPAEDETDILTLTIDQPVAIIIAAAAP